MWSAPSYFSIIHQWQSSLIFQANFHFSGEKLPDIEYSPEEHKTWEAVFNKLKSLHPTHTCVEYQQNFRQMELEGLLEPTRIPKLSLINKYLQRKICKFSKNSNYCILE